MIPQDEVLPDPCADPIGRKVAQLSATRRNTRHYLDFRTQLMKELKRKGYVTFFGHYQRYHVQRVGQSILYQVPITKRGHLKRFRNKLIRIVCIFGGRSYRTVMAGPLQVVKRKRKRA